MTEMGTISTQKRDGAHLWMKIILPLFLLIFFIMLPATADAANRYWVGAAVGCDGTWADTDCWAATSNGAGAAGVPTSADDVFFDGVGNGASNSTLGASITINSLDMTGYVNTLTWSATLTVDGNGVNFKLAAGMALDGTSPGRVTFTGTSGTTLITTAGKTLSHVFTINGTGGTFQLQDTLTITGGSGQITHTAGTFDTNNQIVNSVRWDSAGSGTRTLTMGTSAIGAIITWNYPNVTNLTVTANTATATFNTNTSTFTSAQKDWNGLSLVFTGASLNGVTVNSAGSTFANITYTGTSDSSKANSLAFTSDATITGTLTINGNSSVIRVLVTGTLGTASTITAATVTVTNADFRDITGAGAGSWDLSAITGLSGDAGGNSGITFTTAVPQFWIGDTGNWSDSTQWSTSSGGAANGRVPLPQDDVTFDNGSFSGTSQTVTLDMRRAGKSIDWSAYNEGQTPIWSHSGTVGNFTFYGSVTMISGMTYSSSGGSNWSFEGRGSYTFTTGGKIITNSNITIAMVGGTLTMQDALTIDTSTKVLTFTRGTFNANNFNITMPVFTLTGSGVRTVNMGSGTWTATVTGTAWSALTITNLTFNAGASTIVISNTTATAKSFHGGGLTYNNVIFSGDNITVTGSNTFNQFKVNTSGLATGLILTSGTTQTVTAFSTDASLGRVAKLLSSSAGSAATISQASGMVCGEYLSIKDLTATGGASWYAGNSTSVSGNTGWSFTQCPSPNQTSRSGASSGGPANVKIGSSPVAGGAPGWYSTLWGYRRPIVVDRTRVATTSALTNFPLLISVLDPDLRSTGNGGKVASTTAGDIIFTSSDGTTLLDFEIEKYVSTTGELIAWVEIPSLSGVTDTKIFMYLGNTVITVPLSNPAGVWDSNYKLVWHLPDGSSLTANDSTSNGYSGTLNNSPTATTGKIDGAVNFSGASQTISNSSIGFTGNITMQAWVFPTGSGYQLIMGRISGCCSRDWVMYLDTAGGSAVDMDLGGFAAITVSPQWQSNKWNHIVGTADGTTWRIYINGVFAGSAVNSGTALNTVGRSFIVGQGSDPLTGKLDEVRVSSFVRGSDWIATEYNNQSNPANFYSYQGLENMNGRVNSSGVSVPFLKIRGGVKFR